MTGQNQSARCIFSLFLHVSAKSVFLGLFLNYYSLFLNYSYIYLFLFFTFRSLYCLISLLTMRVVICFTICLSYFGFVFIQVLIEETGYKGYIKNHRLVRMIYGKDKENNVKQSKQKAHRHHTQSEILTRKHIRT